MKNFLVVFLGSAEGESYQRWQALPETEREVQMTRGMQAWQGWMQKHAEHVVDPGGPLSKTLRILPGGISPCSNALCGYMIVRANTQQDAAQLFVDHPHFTIFPGEAVEVMECLPIPGQCESM